MARCIIELERIYGIRQGSANNKGVNQYVMQYFDDGHNVVHQKDKTQDELADKIGIDERQLRNYKKLNELIPELQSFVELGGLKATTAFIIEYKPF